MFCSVYHPADNVHRIHILQNSSVGCSWSDNIKVPSYKNTSPIQDRNQTKLDLNSAVDSCINAAIHYQC